MAIVGLSFELGPTWALLVGKETKFSNRSSSTGHSNTTRFLVCVPATAACPFLSPVLFALALCFLRLLWAFASKNIHFHFIFHQKLNCCLETKKDLSHQLCEPTLLASNHFCHLKRGNCGKQAWSHLYVVLTIASAPCIFAPFNLAIKSLLHQAEKRLVGPNLLCLWPFFLLHCLMSSSILLPFLSSFSCGKILGLIDC